MLLAAREYGPSLADGRPCDRPVCARQRHLLYMLAMHSQSALAVQQPPRTAATATSALQACSESVSAAIYTPPTDYASPGADMRLAQAIVVHRHGDRAPISHGAGRNLKCQPATWAARLPSAAELAALNASFPVHGPVNGSIDVAEAPFGQLTTTGAAQCVALGQWLRDSLQSHAPHLLPSDPQHVVARVLGARLQTRTSRGNRQPCDACPRALGDAGHQHPADAAERAERADRSAG